MKRVKGKQVMAAVCFLGVLLTARSVYAVDIYYRNQKVITDVDPVIENGRTLVPIAVIAEKMGAEAEWEAKTKKIRIRKGDLVLHMTLGRKEFGLESKEGGYTGLFDVPAKSIGGRTMVPLGTVAEVFGSQVHWDAKSKSVLIDSDPAKLNLISKNEGEGKGKNESKEIQILRRGLQKVGGFYAEISQNRISLNENPEYWNMQINGLRERKPGRYLIYDVEAEEGYVFSFAAEKSRGEIYELSRGVYALPGHKVIVPPPLDEEDGLEELFYHLMIQTGKAGAQDTVQVSGKPEKNGDYIRGWRVDVKILSEGKKEVSERYEIDIHGRKIREAKTKKVIFDDSAVQHYPEKTVTKENAGREVMQLLQKLQITDADGKYIIMEAAPFSAPAVDMREGFLVDIRRQAPDPDVTNLVGTYFINTTGTVLMVFDPVADWYIYLYGAHTPMG